MQLPDRLNHVRRVMLLISQIMRWIRHADANTKNWLTDRARCVVFLFCRFCFRLTCSLRLLWNSDQAIQLHWGQCRRINWNVWRSNWNSAPEHSKMLHCGKLGCNAKYGHAKPRYLPVRPGYSVFRLAHQILVPRKRCVIASRVVEIHKQMGMGRGKRVRLQDIYVLIINLHV